MSDPTPLIPVPQRGRAQNISPGARPFLKPYRFVTRRRRERSSGAWARPGSAWLGRCYPAVWPVSVVRRLAWARSVRVLGFPGPGCSSRPCDPLVAGTRATFPTPGREAHRASADHQRRCVVNGSRHGCTGRAGDVDLDGTVSLVGRQPVLLAPTAGVGRVDRDEGEPGAGNHCGHAVAQLGREDAGDGGTEPLAARSAAHHLSRPRS
jgi:hypothetical protein